jgi:hypothetical protein
MVATQIEHLTEHELQRRAERHDGDRRLEEAMAT